MRGPIVTQGYFKNPVASKAAFRNGWFATGDIAVVRNGKFYIVDRMKVIYSSTVWLDFDLYLVLTIY